MFSLIGSSSATVLYMYGNFQIIPSEKLYFMKRSFFVILYNFFNRKWFVDKIYNEFINQTVLKIGYYKTYKLIDRGIIENLGPFGISKFFYNNSMKVNFLQTGLIYHSAFVMLISIILLFSFIGFSSKFGFFLNINLIFIFIVLIFFILFIEKYKKIKL